MKLALEMPWGAGSIPVNNPATNFPAGSFRLADAITAFADVAIFAGAFLMFFWTVWGVFDYIRAEGNKEALAKARKRIQWAVVGFIILMLSFFLSDFVQTVLDPRIPSITPVEIIK